MIENKCCLDTIDQNANSQIDQRQDACQKNVAKQILALALAENNSSAFAVQIAYQANGNEQYGDIDAKNLVEEALAGCPIESCCDTLQKAHANLIQAQYLQHGNFNKQADLVAFARGETCNKEQLNYQENYNQELANVNAKNIDCTEEQAAFKDPRIKAQDLKKPELPEKPVLNTVSGLIKDLSIDITHRRDRYVTEISRKISGEVIQNQKEVDSEASILKGDQEHLTLNLMLNGKPLEITVDENNTLIVNGDKVTLDKTT